MTRSPIVICVMVVMCNTFGNVIYARGDVDAIIQAIERRSLIDHRTNWMGKTYGEYLISEYDSEGNITRESVGRYAAIFSDKTLCISYGIQAANRTIVSRYLIDPDNSILPCWGAIRISDISALPFDPFEIIQRPNSMDRYEFGWSDWWVMRINEFFDVEIYDDT